MNCCHHFQLMAIYNRRLNKQVYQASTNLSSAELEEGIGAFFKSILGTLNHIVVGDLLWLSRFATHSIRYQSLTHLTTYPQPSSLDEQLYDNLDAYWRARKDIDDRVHEWLSNEVLEADFERDLTYTNSKGIVSKRNFAELVSHLFNHQTHHRGQVSALLYQKGIDIGVSDFLMDIPDTIIK
ncbi:DinB family protein [Neptunomonas japonica]|uniref:DinB family protein n=1 Tax=Neptunomonas japonica TaxID=417574 RepID=UPI0004056959|nr:DinB family protein [Neptunomonas japonica]